MAQGVQANGLQGVQANGHAAKDGRPADGQPLELTVLGMNSGTSMVSALQQVGSKGD